MYSFKSQPSKLSDIWPARPSTDDSAFTYGSNLERLTQVPTNSPVWVATGILPFEKCECEPGSSRQASECASDGIKKKRNMTFDPWRRSISICADSQATIGAIKESNESRFTKRKRILRDFSFLDEESIVVPEELTAKQAKRFILNRKEKDRSNHFIRLVSILEEALPSSLKKVNMKKVEVLTTAVDFIESLEDERDRLEVENQNLQHSRRTRTNTQGKDESAHSWICTFHHGEGPAWTSELEIRRGCHKMKFL